MADQPYEAGRSPDPRRGLTRLPALAPPEARIVLRPLGNPLTLGFLALTGATTLVAALRLEWLPAAQGDMVARILLAFVAPLQLVFSVLGYLARDAIAGTGMGALAGTWASVGLVLAAVALYAALAFLLEDVQRATKLPLGRRGSGRASMDEGVSAQLDRIEHEAGVREQL